MVCADDANKPDIPDVPKKLFDVMIRRIKTDHNCDYDQIVQLL